MIAQNKANTLLSYLVGASAPTKLSNAYLGLCANEPAASTGEITGEPESDYYARIPVVGKFDSPAGGVVDNSGEIQMTTAREALGKMYWWFLSESTTGNAYLWGKLYDKDNAWGIEIRAETVPVFYEHQLKASIDVALE